MFPNPQIIRNNSSPTIKRDKSTPNNKKIFLYTLFISTGELNLQMQSNSN